jgi:hypothetical protein
MSKELASEAGFLVPTCVCRKLGPKVTCGGAGMGGCIFSMSLLPIPNEQTTGLFLLGKTCPEPDPLDDFLTGPRCGKLRVTPG